MGLAASQARFLGLTARKSNVEYQVQQINQQRTALSNEIMGLYNEYNNLEVPTPPVVTDYMKTEFSFESGMEQYTIDNFSKITDGEYAGFYNLSLSWTEDNPIASSKTFNNVLVSTKKENNEYSEITIEIGTEKFSYIKDDEENSNIKKITYTEANSKDYPELNTIAKENWGTYYSFIKDGKTYYTSQSDLDNTNFNQENQYNGAYSFDFQNTTPVIKNTNAIGAITQENNGRLGTVKILECSEYPELVSDTYSVSTLRYEDNLAHEEATNDYEYRKMLYEREVEKINYKTKKIQEEDRALELQIRQLDTEQNALNTEMDSVKKVIEDTMEKVFKTFSG